jgi:hypothetical protein
MTHRAKVAWRKGHIVRKDQTRDKVARGAPKGRKLERRYEAKLECKNGIKDPGIRWQLHLKIGRTSDGLDRKAFGLEFMKRAAGRSSALQKMRDWTLWRGQPPPKWKKSLLAALV